MGQSPLVDIDATIDRCRSLNHHSSIIIIIIFPDNKYIHQQTISPLLLERAGEWGKRGKEREREGKRGNIG